MALTKNVYPPLLNAYQPAFDMRSKTGCKFYFQISTLNNIKEIKHIQLTCNNLVTNKNALYSSGSYNPNRPVWKNKIRFYQLDEVGFDDEKGMYYVYLTNNDMQGGFSNTTYKVQIRFGTIPFNYATDDSASWLTANLNNFSEWSTVCIIKAIPTPEFAVVGFSDDLDQETVLQSSALNCIGQYYCSDASEVLQSFRFKVYDGSGNIVEDSGLISCPVYAGSDDYVTVVDNKQVIQYNVQAFLEEGKPYTLEWYYITKNYYENMGSYNFTVIQIERFPLNAEVVIIPDEKNGRNLINISFEDLVIGNLAIRRTSNRTDFQKWEDIKIVQVNNTGFRLTEYDYTIESGVWYKYGIQRINNRDERGPIIIGYAGYFEYDHDSKKIVKSPSREVINDYDSCFLYGNGIQLKLEYNTTVQSFQNTVLESKTDTIGSRYSFIRRNGNAYYKEFPISSLITGVCDNENLFTTPDEMFGSTRASDLYDTYNTKNNISKYYDYNYEREFRNLVYKFLYDGSNKLFKSPTEGAIIVRLMNVSFTPEQVLGRLIYTLNCNAYEQGDTSFNSLSNLGILSRGNFEVNKNIMRLYNSVGQIYGKIKSGEDIVQRIVSTYAKSEGGYLYKIRNILSIHVEAPPGTRMKINNQNIVMGITGIYDYDDDVISSLIIYANSNDTIEENVWELTDISVDFIYQMSVEEDTTRDLISSYNYKVIGELYQPFKANEDVISIIKKQYYDDQYPNFITEVIRVDAIRIEAHDIAQELQNGTVVYRKIEFRINDIDPPFVMNDSGIYELQENIVNVDSLKFTTDTVAKIEYIVRVRKGFYRQED